MLLNKANLEIAKLASDDESRYSLCALYISKKETVVTDGHQLTVVSTPDPKLTESFPMVEGFECGIDEFQPFMINKKAAASLAGAIPKKSPIPILNYACVGKEVGENVPFVATDLESPRLFTFKKVPGSFPNYMQVVPTKKPKFTIDFNPALMQSVLGTMAKCMAGNKLPCVRLQFYSAEEQIRIDGKNEETGQWITSVVMPMKGMGNLVRDFSVDPWGDPAPAAEEPKAETAEAPAEGELPAEVTAEAVSLNGGTAGEASDAGQAAAPAEPAKPAEPGKQSARAERLNRMKDYWKKRKAAERAKEAPEPDPSPEATPTPEAKKSLVELAKKASAAPAVELAAKQAAAETRIAALEAAIEPAKPAAPPKTAPAQKPAGTKAANGWDDPEIRAKRIAAIKAARAAKTAA